MGYQRNRCAVWVVFALGLVVAQPALAGTFVQSFQGFTKEATPRPSVVSALGQVALAVGDVRLVVPEKRVIYPAIFALPLAHGDVIVTGKDGRCQVLLSNGHVLHVGPESQVAFSATKGQLTADVWGGQGTFFALPRLDQESAEFRLGTPQGDVMIARGKIALDVQKAQLRLLVLDHDVRWIGEKASQNQFLAAGQMLTSRGGDIQVAGFKADVEGQVTHLNSPEVWAVQRGVAAFKDKDLSSALSIFKQISQAFPYNAETLYYLGLIYMTKGEDGAAIQNWRRYEQVDPQGAEQKKIAKHLTLLTDRYMTKEVKEALNRERTVGDGSVEPNSVAVPPFFNNGDSKYRILSKGLSAMVIADLSKVPGLKVLEREKLQKIVDEIALSQSGLVAKETQIRAGKLMRAEKMILGDYKVSQ